MRVTKLLVGSACWGLWACGAGLDPPGVMQDANAIAVWPTGCPAGSVVVAPTDDLQALVVAHDAGTTFCLEKGVHHDSVHAIKSGDTFRSPNGSTADGVIENGSVRLQGWTQVSIGGKTYWRTAGGTPLAPAYDNSKCEVGYPACNLPQNLYFNDVDYTPVTSLAAVDAGTWLYDVSGAVGPANDVYLSDSPIGHVVELGVLSQAFESSTADNVTVQGLIVEKYAAQIGDAAIEARAPGWLITRNEARLNHGWGIGGRPGSDGVQILYNLSHDNGQFGIAGGSMHNGNVSHNVMVHNNIDHIVAGFGAGGFKTGGSHNLLVSYNVVHDNLGNGLHADVFCDGVTFDHNTVYANSAQGIRYEISDHGTITNNVLYGNGLGNVQEPGTFSQIGYAASSHGTIRGNVIASPAGTPGGVSVGYSSARGGCGSGCTVPVGMAVSGNRIYVPGGASASALLDTSGTASTWIVPGIFDGNTYCVPSTPWNGANWQLSTDSVAYDDIGFANWQQAHQDAHGVLSTTCAVAPGG